MPNKLYLPPTLTQIGNFVYILMDVRQKEASFIHDLSIGSPLNDINLNFLYSIIMSKHNVEEQIRILMTANFLGSITNWLHEDGFDYSIRFKSERSLIHLIELMGVIVGYEVEIEETDGQMLQIAEGILTHFYKVVQNSNIAQLRIKYLDCISKIFAVKPSIFNTAIYAEMMSEVHDKFDEFYDFIRYYFSREEQKAGTITLILKGFLKRIKLFSEMSSLTKYQKQGLINVYFLLFEFMKKDQNQSFLEQLFKDHLEILEYPKYLLRLLSDLDLAKILNLEVEMIMNSKIGNIQKYLLVLSLYKHILSRSSSIFSFMKTEFLVEDRNFLNWFVETELTYEKGKQVVESYLKNSRSLEFLLVMLIYYLSNFEAKMPDIKRFISCVGFLEESKDFICIYSIKVYFGVFYRQLQDIEYFEDFLNRVEDSNDRLQL